MVKEDKEGASGQVRGEEKVNFFVREERIFYKGIVHSCWQQPNKVNDGTTEVIMNVYLSTRVCNVWILMIHNKYWQLATEKGVGKGDCGYDDACAVFIRIWVT